MSGRNMTRPSDWQATTTGVDSENDDELYSYDKPDIPVYRHDSHLHATREPQAALHVPTLRSFRPNLEHGPADIDHARRTKACTDSLSDRSPLQRLEGKLDGYSKEEKRARIQQAEGRTHRNRHLLQKASNAQQRHPTANAAFPRRVMMESSLHRTQLPPRPSDLVDRRQSDTYPHPRTYGADSGQALQDRYRRSFGSQRSSTAAQPPTRIGSAWRSLNVPSPSTTESPRPINQLPPFSEFEWKSASTARLELNDLALDKAITSSRRIRPDDRHKQTANVAYTPYDDSKGYQPKISTNCGPLLRYKGLRKETKTSQQGAVIEREIWRGSVMIVTSDDRSSYSPPPLLKLFAQPLKRHIPAPSSDNTPKVTPLRSNDGDKLGKSRQVRGARLHAERDLTFWRFNIEVELGLTQSRVAYRINNGPSIGFWVPARGSTMNIMFHSCNDFGLGNDQGSLSEPDPLWRDALNAHAKRPFHVMIGGGGQIWNNRVSKHSELFQQWLSLKDERQKRGFEFTQAMRNELEGAYLSNYSSWFSRGLFSLANSQIPMVNLWDDHETLDGYGSYPDDLMKSPVLCGLGNVAFKYYMLFQHQAVPHEGFRDETSWIMGASLGPYINHHSRNIFMSLGQRVAFLGIDSRTERRRDEITSHGTYQLIFNRCRAEIVQGRVKHLLVLVPLPMALPSPPSSLLSDDAVKLDPMKSTGKYGYLDNDHWTAKQHKKERQWLVQELQELAAEKSIRITILSGGVKLGAVGRFYSPQDSGVPKDRDHRYMLNVVSSPIVNNPATPAMGESIRKLDNVRHLDTKTDEEMVDLFSHDVDGSLRDNTVALLKRNYCTIRESPSGMTMPLGGTRTQSAVPQDPQRSPRSDEMDQSAVIPRSGSMTRGSWRPANLLRRLSGAGVRDFERPGVKGENIADGIDQPQRRRFSFGGRIKTLSRWDYDNTYSTEDVSLEQRQDDEEKSNGSLEDDINLEGCLDISLHVEFNQGDPTGNTVPYRLLVPALWYTKPREDITARSIGRRASLVDRIRGRRVISNETVIGGGP